MHNPNYKYKVYPINQAKVEGIVEVSGAKNSVLPIICASFINRKRTHLQNVPNLNDVNVLLNILKSIGVKSDFFEKQQEILIEEFNFESISINIESPDTRKIRYSLLLMGALLGAGIKEIKINLPGGCGFSERPYDIHLAGFEKMGCSVFEYENHIEIKAVNGLNPSVVELRFPSVGATENLLMAACGVNGVTILKNVAIEPEIIDLIDFLKKLNISIEFIDTRTVKIDSQNKRDIEINHYIIPDRIEAISWVILGALTSDEGIYVKNIDINHLFAPLLELQNLGVDFKFENGYIDVKKSKFFNSSDLISDVYPKLATDYLPMFAVLLSMANGTSSIVDTIYPKRFGYLNELQKMSLVYLQKNGEAIIRGNTNYTAAEVTSTDLRGGFAALLAGLLSNGETIVTNAYQIDRGYSNLVEKMQKIGIKIERMNV